MIDVDHNGGVECWEFIKALSKGDDYDRAVDGSSSKGGGLGSGRLNADGTLKDCYKKNFHVPTENPLALHIPFFPQARFSMYPNVPFTSGPPSWSDFCIRIIKSAIASSSPREFSVGTWKFFL